jgi:hypothetical protein
VSFHLGIETATYPTLKHDNLIVGQSIGFGNDWNKVDFRVKTLHELDINWLEPVYEVSSGSPLSPITHECPVGWMK